MAAELVTVLEATNMALTLANTATTALANGSKVSAMISAAMQKAGAGADPAQVTLDPTQWAALFSADDDARKELEDAIAKAKAQGR